MPLVNSKLVFQKAYGNYSIGAFNVNNLEIIQAITEVADELKSPVILQVSQGARKYAGSEYIKHLVQATTQIYPHLPIILHLDHGDSFDLCKSCIDDGFTSVMIDASHLSFEENIAVTSKVVEYAHDHNVTVEAELGKLAGIEEHINVSEQDAVFTNPEQAAEFIQKTNCDSLAIAIGTSHGAYKFSGTPHLDFDRLEKINAITPKNYPLVLHGASSVPTEFIEKINQYGGTLKAAQGVPENLLKQSSKLGICKINIDTDIRLAFTSAIRQSIQESPDQFDPRYYLKQAREAVKYMVSHKIKNVLGSDNQL